MVDSKAGCCKFLATFVSMDADGTSIKTPGFLKRWPGVGIDYLGSGRWFTEVPLLQVFHCILNHPRASSCTGMRGD
jgi:hypothetical protein